MGEMYHIYVLRSARNCLRKFINVAVGGTLQKVDLNNGVSFTERWMSADGVEREMPKKLQIVPSA